MSFLFNMLYNMLYNLIFLVFVSIFVKNDVDMNKFLLLNLMLIMTFMNCLAEDDSGKSFSGAILVNPPNPSIDWNFEGNQLIHTEIMNNNMLGVMLSVECKSYANSAPVSTIVAPMVTVVHDYSMFGYTPICWSFIISTYSDVANIICKAEWQKFRPDRPGFPPDIIM